MGRLRALLHAQPENAIRNATRNLHLIELRTGPSEERTAQPANLLLSSYENGNARPAELRVAHTRERNAQSTANGSGDDPMPDPAAEARRQRVLAKLTANPALRLAVVCDAEGDPVPMAVAIRGKGACEVNIPAARFDPFALIELVGRHGGTIH